MGILAWFGRKSGTIEPVRYYHGTPSHANNFELNLEGLFDSVTPGALYESQPHLRTVIDFLAENVAQVGLHPFKRDADNGRTRDRSSVLARLLERPNPDESLYEIMYSIVADLGLHDIALLRVIPTTDIDYPYELRVIKAAWVIGTKGGNIYGPEYYVVRTPEGAEFDFPAADIITFKGWNPTSYKSGSSKVNTLKGILAEQAASYAAREANWKRNGRHGGVLSRPVDAPPWNEATEKRFMRNWNKNALDPARGGEDVLLQDGMTYAKTRYSATEEGWIEGIKLSLATVAGVYHVNPAMIGNSEQINYANVKELRRMLYGETLMPIFKAIAQKLNLKLIDKLGLDRSVYYLEFNIREKLQGSFEEQAAVMQTLVGRPIMTPNEARPLFNLNLLDSEDANALATPLNMLLAGQTPAIGSTPPKGGDASLKALAPVLGMKERAASTYEEKVQATLTAFFKRQQSSVLSKLGAKADEDWWDAERWNTELAADLYKLAAMVTEIVGIATMEANGYEGSEYNVDQTLAWLAANSQARAEMINAVTKRQLDEVLASDNEDDEEAPTPKDVFEDARGNRAAVAAATLVTTYSAFAAVEAAKQRGGQEATKTWVTTSNNPRNGHKRMNGETVAINAKFSNGALWPGDAALDVDDLANCKCDIEINF